MCANGIIISLDIKAFYEVKSTAFSCYTQKYCYYCALLVYGYSSSYYYSIGELAGKVFGVSASSTLYLSADIATVSLCIQREGIS